MKKAILVGLLLGGMAWAGEAKILDVQSFSKPGMAVSANGGYSSTVINYDMFTVTVALNDSSYSAQFYSGRHFKPTDLVVGDSVQARVDGGNLIITRPDGKEAKAKIVRRERLTSLPASPQSASR